LARLRLSPDTWRVVAAFAAVYIIWGSTYLAIRWAIETLPPFLMAGIRFVIAGGLIYAWVRLRGGPRPGWLNWRAAFVVGGLLLLGGNGMVVVAEQWVPSGLTALLIATTPLWMVLLDWAQRGVRPGLGVAFGLVVGLVGIVLLIGPDQVMTQGTNIHLGGALLILGASVSWAVGSIYSRRAALPASPLLATGMEMLGGGILLLLAGTLAGEWPRLNVAAISLRSGLALAFLIIFGSLVAFTAYVWLLKNVSAGRVSTYAYVNPVVAVFLGWALASEPLTTRTLIAAAVIVAAVAIITTYRAREPRPAAQAKPAPAATNTVPTARVAPARKS
jgi:drug/metabolite transporter (DMT)-like permease